MNKAFKWYIRNGFRTKGGYVDPSFDQKDAFKSPNIIKYD